ncbi:MAG: HAMP domain-containing histidine kinase [Chloroflexi bacterium]|nr:HAMP domain-containing histidine kinase [Chloroflexota bacterium]
MELLQKIRGAWIARVSARLARGESVRHSFQSQLSSFYDLLLQSVATGDAAWLNGLLDDWVGAGTQTELEQNEGNLPHILDQILFLTYEVAVENLDNEGAIQVIGAILPVYSHAYEYTANKEAQLKIEHITRRLELARNSIERLDRSKSDFISVAAHELRTPLTLIEGYAAMLQEAIHKQGSVQHIDILLKGVGNGTQRLKEIVDDMIDVSLIDNQMLELNFQPVWINRLLEGIQGDFREVTNERKITLAIREFPGSQEMTFGDAERLYQALRNVIANAIKFTPDGGSVTIYGRSLPGFIEVLVADSGIGIDANDHARIFEKFGRLGNATLHSSSKTNFKGGGPGLGLPIAKGLIEAHGGAIWVESPGYDEVNCPGSIFHILLPLRKEPPDEKMARLFRGYMETGVMGEIYD